MKICSSKLFEDLQAEFRQATNLKANEQRINTNEQITKNKLESTLKMTKIEEESKTKKQINDNTQELRRKQEEAKYYENTCTFEKKRIENETLLNKEKSVRDA